VTGTGSRGRTDGTYSRQVLVSQGIPLDLRAWSFAPYGRQRRHGRRFRGLGWPAYDAGPGHPQL